MISLLVGDQQAPNLNRIFGYSRNSERHIGYLHWISIMVGNVHIIKHHQHNPEPKGNVSLKKYNDFHYFIATDDNYYNFNGTK